MNSVNHFEIPADDMKRADAFYSTVFGWASNHDMGDDTILVSTTETGDNGIPKNPGAINGDISKRQGPFKHPLIVVTVDSIEDHFKTIEENGGQKLSDKTEIPGMGYFAYIGDSEGNTIGIWQNL